MLSRSLSAASATARTSRWSQSRRGSFKTGCLIATGAVLLLLIGVGIWVAVSWKSWASNGIRSVTIAAVNGSQMPADQKQKVTSKVDEVTKAWEDGKLSNDQFGKIIQEIAQSPLLPLAVVYGIEEKHIKPSTLPKEEKDAGVRAMQRAARGVAEKSISPQTIRDILAPVTIQNPGSDQMQVKEKVTDEELRQLFKNAKNQADSAKVPDEPYKINVGDELAKAVDKALGKPTTDAPAIPAPSAPAAPAAPGAGEKK